MIKLDVGSSGCIWHKVVTIDNGCIWTPVGLVPEAPHQYSANSFMTSNNKQKFYYLKLGLFTFLIVVMVTSSAAYKSWSILEHAGHEFHLCLHSNQTQWSCKQQTIKTSSKPSFHVSKLDRSKLRCQVVDNLNAKILKDNSI